MRALKNYLTSHCEESFDYAQDKLRDVAIFCIFNESEIASSRLPARKRDEAMTERPFFKGLVFC